MTFCLSFIYEFIDLSHTINSNKTHNLYDAIKVDIETIETTLINHTQNFTYGIINDIHETNDIDLSVILLKASLANST